MALALAAHAVLYLADATIVAVWPEVLDPMFALPSGLAGALVVHGLLAPVAFLVSAIGFCMWMHRSAKNLRAFGHQGLEFTPGGAVGWFFIPFANLGKPYHTMVEIWRGSEPDFVGTGSPTAWLSARASGIVGAWWGLWIASNILSTVSLRLSMRESSTTGLDLADAFLNAAAAMCAILVLRGVTARQAECAAKLKGGPRLGDALAHAADRASVGEA